MRHPAVINELSRRIGLNADSLGDRGETCFRKLILYCGITFNDHQSARLIAHL